MRVLVDTNVLARLVHKNHPQASIANMALSTLRTAGHELRIVPQVLYEYWSVATRPTEQNGLGFPVEVVTADVERFKRIFSVLRDERGILDPWQQIAYDCKVSGKQVHDARLAAAMLRHGLTHLLTFNVQDFKRYPSISVLDPNTVVHA